MRKSQKNTAKVVALALFAISLYSCNSGSNSNEIAFYGIPAEQQKAISEQIQKNSPETHFTFVVLNEDEPLAPQTDKHTNAVITFMGKNADTLSEKAFPVEANAYTGTSMAMQGKALRNESGNILELPLLTDTYEIDLDKLLLKKTKLKCPATWAELENFAEKSRTAGVTMPVVFAGKNSSEFISILGLIEESFSGKDAVEKAASRLAESSGSENKMEIVKELCDSPDAPLYAATHTLARWMRAGLLNRSVFNFTNEDVSGFMEAKDAAVVFMTLSDHRKINSRILERYDSLPQASSQQIPFVPQTKRTGSRALSSPVICAVSLSKNKAVNDALKKLVSAKSQEELSRATGIAPVNSSCRTPDTQADDVRFWIAATGTPLTPLSDLAFTSSSEKDEWSKVFKQYIIELSIN